MWTTTCSTRLSRRNATERVAMLLMHLYQRLGPASRAGGRRWFGAFRSTSSALPMRSGCRWVHQQDAAAPGLSSACTGPEERAAAHAKHRRALARIAEYYDRPPRLLPAASACRCRQYGVKSACGACRKSAGSYCLHSSSTRGEASSR